MYILTKNKGFIINIDRADAIGLNPFDNKKIVAYFSEAKSELASYETEERAKEVFEELISYIRENTKYYEMPEWW